MKDMTGRTPTVHPLAVAHHIQCGLLEQLSIPVSIGIAPNKFLAKMASEMKKPLGITVLRKRDVPAVLWPLPVEQMHGVGDKTAKKLHALGLRTIGDVARTDRELFRQIFGVYGLRLHDRANGIDPRSVDPDAGEKRKSAGHSTTLPYDMDKERELLAVLRQLATDDPLPRFSHDHSQPNRGGAVANGGRPLFDGSAAVEKALGRPPGAASWRRRASCV
nr:hypothetical protein [Geobacillus sp. C56-T3]